MPFNSYVPECVFCYLCLFKHDINFVLVMAEIRYDDVQFSFINGIKAFGGGIS